MLLVSDASNKGYGKGFLEAKSCASNITILYFQGKAAFLNSVYILGKAAIFEYAKIY